MCNRLAEKIRPYLSILGALLLVAQALGAEELRLGGPDGWSEWKLPGDAVDIADGVLKPAFVRQNTDAVQNVALFGGGIRGAGTALDLAARLIDGHAETAWTPAAETPLEDWWIEVDLGRVVSARTIRLHFAEGGEPLEFFKVFTSDGEPFFTNAGVAIEGTLRYNNRRLYSFNQDRVIEIDFGLKPLKHIRIQADKKTLGAQLSELSVESVGDNLSLGARERGGQIDDLTISTQVLTPNGDGVGDRFALEFNLLKVLDPRTVRVAIFDLTGRQVHLLSEEEQVAGRVALEWDGRDHAGGLVAPGNYVLRVEVSGDARTERVSRIVSVAY